MTVPSILMHPFTATARTILSGRGSLTRVLLQQLPPKFHDKLTKKPFRTRRSDMNPVINFVDGPDNENLTPRKIVARKSFNTKIS